MSVPLVFCTCFRCTCTDTYKQTNKHTVDALAHKETHTYTHSCHASFDLIYDLVYVVGIANLSFNLISTMRAWSDPVYQEQCMAMNISMVRSMYSAACDGAAAEGVLGLWNQPCDITSVLLFGVLMLMMMELWLFEVSDIHAHFMMIGRVHHPAPNFTHLFVHSSHTSTPSRAETTSSIACCSCCSSWSQDGSAHNFCTGLHGRQSLWKFRTASHSVSALLSFSAVSATQTHPRTSKQARPSTSQSSSCSCCSFWHHHNFWIVNGNGATTSAWR